MMIFLCGSQTIQHNLLKAHQEYRKDFGNCIFYFGLVEEVLQKLKEAPLLKVLATGENQVKAGELNQVSVMVGDGCR